MATLINGDGNAAVYAAQDSDWFAGVEGNTTKILKVGAKMEYEIEDANTIAIKNGVLVTKEGRRVQIDAGAIDEFIIPTGTQGVTRYFIIGYHLYTDASSNQLCETFVQLMANGTDTIPEDTFRGGSTDVYVSLYRVKQDGITLDTIQSLLPEGVDLDGIGDEIDDIKDDIDQINSDLTELTEANYYSEYEYECGNWFGLPLYRKVFRNTGTGTRSFNIGIDFSNIRRLEGYLKYGTLAYIIPPYYQTDTDWFNFFISSNNCNVRGAGAFLNNPSEFTLIVEYTK